MSTCKEIYGFLNQVSVRSVTTPASDPDQAVLAQLGLVQFLSADQYRQLSDSVQSISSSQQAIAQETAQRVGLALDVAGDTRETHSLRFHLEGKEKRDTLAQREASDEARLKSIDQDLAQKQQQFDLLVAQRSLFDTLTPCGVRYAGLTALGSVELRELGLALYRVSDSDFGAYWNQAQRITQDLTGLASVGAQYFGGLALGIEGADPSQLWAIAIGLAKNPTNPFQGTADFVRAYDLVVPFSDNVENRLLSAETLSAVREPVAETLPALNQILKDVRKLNVPRASALGVASILLLGRRADGTVATPSLAQYLRLTQSFESAALLAIVNVPVDSLGAKFGSLRSMFASWGYRASEDVELSSAYLAVSELPVEGIATKLAIIVKGLSIYLEYPLVAAAVLASLSTLEANETLNLLGRAYDIVGRRAVGLSQGELICLAVRMLHGIRDELVAPLDATARVPPPPPPTPGMYGPRFFFVPIIVAHNAYFSTYSGIGGAHPGHVHGFGGGAGGFVG